MFLFFSLVEINGTPPDTNWQESGGAGMSLYPNWCWYWPVRISAAQVLGKVIQEAAVPPPTLLTGPFVTVITEVWTRQRPATPPHFASVSPARKMKPNTAGASRISVQNLALVIQYLGSTLIYLPPCTRQKNKKDNSRECTNLRSKNKKWLKIRQK